MISIVFFTSSSPAPVAKQIPRGYTYGQMFEDAERIGATGMKIVEGRPTEDFVKLEEVTP